MKIAIISVVLLGLITAYSFNSSSKSTTINSEKEEGIHFFNGTWNQALIQAKKENKIIFLDTYATWCGPCKLLKNKTFKDKDVADYFNENFINVEVDAEKGEGIDLVEKYGVEAFPTLIFVNSDGTLIGKTMGYYKAPNFLELGEKVIQSQKK